jgi:hypothetical protein
VRRATRSPIAEGVGRNELSEGSVQTSSLVRIEVLVAFEKFERMISYISKEVRSGVPVTRPCRHFLGNIRRLGYLNGLRSISEQP